jgi:aspartokinase
MKTVAEEIREIIAESPFLEDGLARGIINCSALAREIRPRVEAALYKDVSEGAVVMALKRLAGNLARNRPVLQPVLRKMGDLTVRSNLMEFTFRKSRSTLARQQELLDRVKDWGEEFLTFTQGVYETTIICSATVATTVEDVFAKETRTARLVGLAAIIIRLPEETVETPGVHYSILKQLAWNNINVVEVVSTYTELTVILSRVQVDQAFSVLMKYLQD